MTAPTRFAFACIFFATACGGPDAVKPPTPGQAAASEKKRGDAKGCAAQYVAIDDLRLVVDDPDVFEERLVVALAACEGLLSKSSPALVGMLQRGASLIDAAAADTTLDPEEVAAYGALVFRFAWLGGMRRLLHYGPKLRPLFIAAYERALRTPNPRACSIAHRELGYYLLMTPKALGGEAARGAALLKMRTEARPICARDLVAYLDALIESRDFAKVRSVLEDFGRKKAEDFVSAEDHAWAAKALRARQGPPPASSPGGAAKKGP